MLRNWISRLMSPANGGVPSRRSTRPRAVLSVQTLEDRVTPATLYVDPRFTGSTGSAETFNAGQAGQVTGLTLGTNAFKTVEAAVTTASGGDTIDLAQTTIATSVNFQISKSLNFVGSGIGLTVLTPNASTDPTTSQFDWLRVAGGATVNFTGLTVNGGSPTFGISQAIHYLSSSGTVDTVAFVNIARPANEYDGVGVVVTAPTGTSTVTVRNSTFSNLGREGVVFQDPGTTGTFTNNTYTGKGTGSFIDYGVEVAFGGSAVVSNSTFTNCLGIVTGAGGGTSAAIQATGPGSKLTAFGNTIINNDVGIQVGIDQVDSKGNVTADTPTVTANYNTIYGNNAAIVSNVSASTPVNATLNFFGFSSGPVDSSNPGGIGNAVIDMRAPTNISSFLRKVTPVVASTTGTSPVVATPPQIYAIGAGAGGGPRVDVFKNGALVTSFFAFDQAFTGGVTVASGDVFGTGSTEIVVAAGSGGGPNVKVFDLNGKEIISFYAYGSNFTGGVNLAVGDVDGDGVPDIVTGAGFGGGPNVKVFDGRNGREKLSFFAYAQNYTGGVTVATGDFTGTFIDSIVTGANSIATHVKTFNGVTAAEQSSFFAFNGAATGVYIAAGDIDGSGKAKIFAGLSTGPGQVGVFTQSGQQLQSFQATSAGGARVAAVDLTGTGKDLIAVGSGLNQTTDLHFFNPTTGASVTDTNPFMTTVAGGVFVG